MADGTRLFQLAESVKECQEGWNQQQVVNTNVEQKLTELTEMMQTVIANQTRQPLERPPARRDPGYFPFQNHERRWAPDDHRNDDHDEGWDQEEEVQHIQRGEHHIHTRALRLDFPRFDGTNPSGWSYKVNQFFEYYRTPLYQRIRMASFHMEGEALIWFQDADEAGHFPTWDVFLQALLVRFGPAYDDPMESLVKLRQSSTVAEYTTQFESLSNRLRGLSDKYKLSYFLSGLKDEVRLPLRMLSPQTLVAAFGLAKLQEEYLTSTRRSFRPQGTTLSSGRQQPWGSSGNSFSQPGGSSAPPLSSSSHATSSLPVQKISPAQMRERREKGLCYYCDDKWNPSHRCKSPKLYLMHGSDLIPEDKLDEVFYDSTDGVTSSLDQVTLDSIAPEISLHALSGSLAPKTMRLVGLIQNHRVVILIDSGSTHSFLDPSILNRVSLGVIIPLQLQVRVANGATLVSQGKCKSVSLKVQGTTLTTDFFLLPLGGCDAVLGGEGFWG